MAVGWSCSIATCHRGWRVHGYSREADRWICRWQKRSYLHPDDKGFGRFAKVRIQDYTGSRKSFIHRATLLDRVCAKSFVFPYRPLNRIIDKSTRRPRLGGRIGLASASGQLHSTCVPFVPRLPRPSATSTIKDSRLIRVEVPDPRTALAATTKSGGTARCTPSTACPGATAASLGRG